MIKKLAWNTFKNTGNINTFLELLEVENIEKNLSAQSGINQNNVTNGLLNLNNTPQNFSNNDKNNPINKK